MEPANNNQELQLHGQQHSKIGEVAKFAEAINGKKINNSTEKEISDVLKIILSKLGLKTANLPTPEEKFILITHLRNHYGQHTLDELALAFDMAIAGKLDCDSNPYENFSCRYVSDILNAFRRWAGPTYRSEIKQPLPPELPSPKISEEEIIQTARGLYRTTKNPLYLAANLFKMLNLNPSEEDRTRIRKRAVEIVDKMYFEDKYLFHDISQEKYVNNTAKKLAVAEYFDKEENSKA